MNPPLLTIITVSYNSCDTILQTIKSVAAQGVDWIEYIIIDGDSNDGTKAIINNNTDHINLIISEPDKGIYDAMNKGIKYSKGKFIHFLNSDDFLKTKYVEIVYPHLISEKSDIYSFGISILDKENKIKELYPEPIDFNQKINTQHMYLPHPGLIVRKEIFDIVGLFDIKYKSAADLDWLCRIVLEKININYIKKTILFFRADGQSKSIISYKESRNIAIKYGKSILLSNYIYLKQIVKYYIGLD